MHDWLVMALHNPIIYAMGVGVWVRIRADVEAFENWKELSDVKEYRYDLLGLKIAQGAVAGVIGALSGQGLLSLLQQP